MPVSPLWLFTGPEFGERNDTIAALRGRAEQEAGKLDCYSFYAGDTKIGDVISLLQNGSLFAEARFVVLRSAELIRKKEDVELIAGWAKESANGPSVLILVSEDNSVDRKLETAVPKENRRIFWEMFDDKKNQWVRSFFAKAGYRVDADAVETILELVENNTEALRSECSHFFFCFDKDHVITSADAENILSHNREESAFSLFYRLADGSFEKVLEILQKLRLSKDFSGVQLTAGLTFCFRRLLVWHELHAAGRPSDFDLKTKGFSSRRAQEQYRRACSRWSAEDTNRILALLARTDMDIRSGGTALEECRLQLMLYCIIRKKGFPPAGAQYGAEAV